MRSCTSFQAASRAATATAHGIVHSGQSRLHAGVERTRPEPDTTPPAGPAAPLNCFSDREPHLSRFGPDAS